MSDAREQAIAIARAAIDPGNLDDTDWSLTSARNAVDALIAGGWSPPPACSDSHDGSHHWGLTACVYCGVPVVPVSAPEAGETP